MNYQPFLSVVVYPVIKKELDEVEELILWPPDEDEADTSDFEVGDFSFEDAVAMARVFAVQAVTEEGAVDILETHLSQYNEKMEAQQFLSNVDIAETYLDGVPPDTTCCVELPLTFLVRDKSPEAIADLFEFCDEALAEEA